MYEQYFKIKEKVKRFNYICISFLSVFAFALCACQSEKQVSGAACVKDVALKANLSGAVSRTTMTDTYGGAFAQTWNNDMLSIYHTYQSNGTAQSLMPLSFKTTAKGTSSAVFNYIDLSDYTYNPGQPLYAFNKLTGTGQCTPSVTGIAATPLSLSLTGWANQDGTLTGTQNAALYDAMAGYATTDAATGVPGSLTMNHLGGIVCFHLISDGFTVGTPVSGITFNDGSSSPSCFPGSATVSVSSDGSTSYTGKTFNSSWNPSGSFTPYYYTENGVSSKWVDVYLSTFPTTLSSPLTVSVSIGSSLYSGSVTPYYALAASKVKVLPIALCNTNYSKLYAWDAINSKPVTVNAVPTNANPVKGTGSYLNQASYACKNCPSYNEITWYLSAQYYWDDGNQGANGGNTTIYTLAESNTTAGMWFRKQSKITGFSSTTAFTGTKISNSVALSGMTSTQISALKLSTDYFFLPAAGYTSYDYGSFSRGDLGFYWSSTPHSDTTNAYYLHFLSDGVYVNYSSRACGFSLWQGQ